MVVRLNRLTPPQVLLAARASAWSQPFSLLACIAHGSGRLQCKVFTLIASIVGREPKQPSRDLNKLTQASPPAPQSTPLLTPTDSLSNSCNIDP